MNGKTILLVEDDPEIREIEAMLLHEEGYRVVELPDGEAVPKTAKDSQAAIILLDLMLPKKHGNAVLSELGEDPATRNLPVIVVSAHPKELVPTKQVKLVLTKPFDVTQLLDAVAVATAPAR